MKKLKHSVRDVIVTLVSLCGATYVYRKMCARKGPLVRVLCFHDVPDGTWFMNVMELLKSEFHVLTPEEFTARSFHDTKINILLTFDDGYQSWVDVCMPIMEQYSFKGLFFINSGLLNAAHDADAVAHFMRDRMLISPKRPLTWEGAAALVASGHSVGGHTVNHTRMSICDALKAEEEVVSDKARHEEKLNVVLTDFAYPFGTKKDYTKETEAIVRSAGYERQYSAVSGFVTEVTPDPIPRTLVEKNQPPRQIRQWIYGGYDLFQKINNF